MAKRHANKSGNLESMFLRLEELILANSGEDEFEEVFKLLIAKLYSELNPGGARFQPGATDMVTYGVVQTLLRDAQRKWPGIVEEGTKIQLTPEHLHVCVGALAPHNISGDGLDVLDSFFEFMVSRAAKGSKGQYFTPRYVVDFCVRMLRPTSRETVLDPACGSGGFLFHVLDYVRTAENLTGDVLEQYCHSNIWGFDIDARAVRVAKALMILAGDGRSNLIRLNSLLRANMVDLLTASEKSDLGPFSVEDVLRAKRRKHKGFDLILTNPPFAGEVLERQILDGYEVSRGKQRIERDVIFIERCVDLLRPGGRMALVLPHNKFAANEFGAIRSWILRKCRVLGVVGLGRNTFMPHTHQKTSILFVQKRILGTEKHVDEKIFFAVSDKDGKNSKGQLLEKVGGVVVGGQWAWVDHDLGEIETSFKQFCIDERVDFGEIHG